MISYSLHVIDIIISLMTLFTMPFIHKMYNVCPVCAITNTYRYTSIEYELANMCFYCRMVYDYIVMGEIL